MTARRPSRRTALLIVLMLGVTVLLGVLAIGRGVTDLEGSHPPENPTRAGESSVAPEAPPEACEGVPVRPGDDLQRASDSQPEGTTFCLKAGVHRLASVEPRRGQRFVGEGAATVLSGAKVLDAGVARSDGAGHWYWGGQTQQDWPRGTLIQPGLAESPNEGDGFSQELFVTPSGHVEDPPTRFRRVLTIADLRPGRWYLDQAADRLYVAQDPATLGLIETSVVPMAIGAPTGTGPADVTIENMVVEKYASPTQLAAVGGPGSADWTIRWVTVRYNHGVGIEMGPGTLVEHCQVHHMGQEGLTGGGTAIRRPTILRSTEVAYNRTLSFQPGWEAGGAKLTHAYGQGLVVENNWFHHNFGNGLWLDIDNDGVIVRSNRVEANDGAGILFEVSRNGQIYWNDVFGQTIGPAEGIFGGAGIWIYNSADVDVHDNLIYGNENGIFIREDRKIVRTPANSFPHGVPHIDRVRIHDNDVQIVRGISGMRVEDGDAVTYWNGNHVLFTHNTYRLDPSHGRFIGPGNANYTFAQWRSLGNDRTSTLLPTGTLGSLGPGAIRFVMSDYGAPSD